MSLHFVYNKKLEQSLEKYLFRKNFEISKKKTIF